MCGAPTCVPVRDVLQPVYQCSVNEAASTLAHHREAVLTMPPPLTCELLENGSFAYIIFVPSVPREEMFAESDDQRQNMEQDASRVRCFSGPGSVSLAFAQGSEVAGLSCSSFRQQRPKPSCPHPSLLGSILYQLWFLLRNVITEIPFCITKNYYDLDYQRDVPSWFQQ